MCEIFKQGKCLGCQALERLEDIDIAKYSCEVYKEEICQKKKYKKQ